MGGKLDSDAARKVLHSLITGIELAIYPLEHVI